MILKNLNKAALLEDMENVPEIDGEKVVVALDHLTGMHKMLAQAQAKAIEEIMTEKNKEVDDFLKDLEEKEPDHTIEAEHKRLHLDESLFITCRIVESYKDVNGIMGEIGAKYSKQDLINIYNENHLDDPSMADYDSVEDWLKDTTMNMEDDNLDESFDLDDLRSEVYEALSNIMFNHRGDGITEKDIELAIDWFMVHFFEDEYYEESLNEGKLDRSDVRKIYSKVLAFVTKEVASGIDKVVVLTVNAAVPEYDPDWCADEEDEDSYMEIEGCVDRIVDNLMNNLFAQSPLNESLKEDLEDDVDHMLKVTNFDDNMIDNLEDNNASLQKEVEEVLDDYKEYFTESIELNEIKTDFDYDKYFLDEETVAAIIDDMMADGIDPWEPSSKDDIDFYLVDECGYSEDDVPGIKKCIKKYVAEHKHDLTVWDAVYNEIVSNQPGIKMVGGLTSNRYKHQDEDVVVENNGITLKGLNIDSFEHDKEVAKFFGFKTVGPYDTGKNTFEFKIIIPSNVQLMKVSEYLESIGK